MKAHVQPMPLCVSTQAQVCQSEHKTATLESSCQDRKVQFSPVANRQVLLSTRTLYYFGSGRSVLKNHCQSAKMLVGNFGYSEAPCIVNFWASTAGHCNQSQPHGVSVCKEQCSLFIRWQLEREQGNGKQETRRKIQRYSTSYEVAKLALAVVQARAKVRQVRQVRLGTCT